MPIPGQTQSWLRGYERGKEENRLDVVKARQEAYAEGFRDGIEHAEAVKRMEYAEKREQIRRILDDGR